MSHNIVHFLPSLLIIELAIKGPKQAPKATNELNQAPSSFVIKIRSPSFVIFGRVGELHVMTEPAATAAKLATKYKQK